LRKSEDRKPELLLPGESFEPADETNLSDEGFDRTWALAVVERIFKRIEEGFRHDKPGLFSRLRPHLTGDIEALPYSQLEKEFGMSSGALRAAAHKLRLRFGELLREEIGKTVATRAEIDDELLHIKHVWVRAG